MAYSSLLRVLCYCLLQLNIFWFSQSAGRLAGKELSNDQIFNLLSTFMGTQKVQCQLLSKWSSVTGECHFWCFWCRVCHWVSKSLSPPLPLGRPGIACEVDNKSSRNRNNSNNGFGIVDVPFAILLDYAVCPPPEINLWQRVSLGWADINTIHINMQRTVVAGNSLNLNPQTY